MCQPVELILVLRNGERLTYKDVPIKVMEDFDWFMITVATAGGVCSADRNQNEKALDDV